MQQKIFFEDFLLVNNTTLTHGVSRSTPNIYYCDKTGAWVHRKETTSEHIVGCLKLSDFIFFSHVEELAHINRTRVKEILEYHDDIEGYPGVGDVGIADTDKRMSKEKKELENLPYLSSIYPSALRDHFLALDKEFREGKTLESKLAHAIDKMQPLIYCAQESYKYARKVIGEDGKYLFSEEKVRERSGPHFLPFPVVHAYFEELMTYLRTNDYFGS